MKTMKIPLTQGKVTLVDAEDYEYLMQWKWYYNRGYAVRNRPERGTGSIYMHRVILERTGFKNFKDSDHINQVKHDNRRSNLRPATRRQNSCNQGKRNNNTSGYIGVYWSKQRGKWKAQIAVGNKRKYLGYFTDKKEAACAYNKAAKKYHGEFSVLNRV